MHDNVWGLRPFMREFIIAAMLNPSLKSRFMQEFNRFSSIKRLHHLKIKNVKKNKKR